MNISGEERGLKSIFSFAMLTFLLLTFQMAFLKPLALAHKGEDHSKQKPTAQPAPADDEALKAINASYMKNVKPIFQKSCFDCHSSSTQYPWYSNLPGAKQLIQKDIAEAKTHLDMSADFPFVSHGTPREDLEAIRDSLRNESMPPLRYRLMHWNSALDEKEQKAVLQWVENGLKWLNEPTSGEK